MINLDKKMTRSEFKNLVKSKYGFLIAYNYINADKDNAFYDYYVSNLHKLTKKESQLEEANKLDAFNLLKAEELRKINKLAFDNTSFNISKEDFKKINIKTLKQHINENKYFLTKRNNSDFCLMFGYWMGILAISSYLLRIGDDERNDTIDDLINADYSLFK